MPRKVAFSHKQKKAQLQAKRALKRGEISPPPSKSKLEHRPRRDRRSQTTESAAQVGRVDAARRLQSSFVKLPKEFLDETRELAASLALHRPIPSDVARWKDFLASPDAADTAGVSSQIDKLSCPRRPQWRYNMSKKEVETNEEGLFKKWLDQTDAVIDGQYDVETAKEHKERMPSAPPSYERNLEVWRQLWRVSEISQILLILLDSRCPLLHYPPSLASYLSSPHLAHKRTILVLTKVDIAGPVRVEAWTRYLKHRYPHLSVVPVESYVEKNTGEGSGSRKAYAPFIPSAFRQALVDALRKAHVSLLEPPENIRDVPEKVKTWKPPVKGEIDWDRVMTAHGERVGSVVGGAAAPRPVGRGDSAEDGEGEPSGDPEGEANTEAEFLTVGVIGQPNVGKSSLLNALFGAMRVRASKTPGKTKHFQTLFWTNDLRLVDCPGLVMPNLVPMETEVLCGILPISRVSTIPLCVHHAAQLLPLELIFDLQHPSNASIPQEDKRTWRKPRMEHQTRVEVQRWTAMDILTALALKHGWVTARVGRPDINRAGNAILRYLAEGRIHWAFWPPDTPASGPDAPTGEGMGIWIPRSGADHYEFDGTSDDDIDATQDSESDSESDETMLEESDDHEEAPSLNLANSRFGALSIDAEDEEHMGDSSDSSGATQRPRA